MATPDTSRSGWSYDRLLVLGAFLCIMAAAPFAATGDLWLSHAALAWPSPLTLMVLKVGSWLGEWTVESALFLLMIGVGFSLRRRRLWATGLCGLSTLYLSGLFTMLLKHTICRARPLLLEGGTFHPPLCFQEGIDSFPSGHATQAFAIAVILAGEYPRLAPLFYGFAALVATSRVALGAHYPSDVLVGAAMGIMWGTICRRQFTRLALVGNIPLVRSPHA